MQFKTLKICDFNLFNLFQKMEKHNIINFRKNVCLIIFIIIGNRVELLCLINVAYICDPGSQNQSEGSIY